MLRIWFNLSLRRFSRNKFNSLINIFGLSVGIIVYLLIFIYVKHEFSYDNFHNEGDLIFRLIKENPTVDESSRGQNHQAVFPAPLADIIKTRIGGVTRVSRLATLQSLVVEIDEKTFYEDFAYAADNDLLKILNFNLIGSNSTRAFEKPNTIAISETTAKKYFGTTDAVGKSFELSGFKKFGDYTVGLVFKDFPSNSSFQFNIILQFTDWIKTARPSDIEDWHSWNYNFLLKTTSKHVNPKDVESQIKQFFVKKYESSANNEYRQTKFLLEPLRDCYLKSDVSFSNSPRNDINRLYILSGVALFILMIAGINYVNLTTASSVMRAKEVGVLKISGALKSTLMTQFLIDTLVVSFISTVVAVLATWMLFPTYINFIGKSIPLNFLDPFVILSIFCIPILFGLVAGMYPAIILASFKPIRVLKGNFTYSGIGNSTRNALTIFQFLISSGLIIAVLIIGQQLEYIENHNPGYQREHILRLSLRDGGVRTKKDVLMAQLNKHPNIIATSIASSFPNQVNTLDARDWIGSNGITKVAFYSIKADPNYLDLFNIQLVKGRNFSLGNENDKNAFLINETAAKVYGWDDPIGMRFTGETEGQVGDTIHIIGVIKDMHISSYRSPIAPLRIGFVNASCWQLAIKIKPTNMAATLSFIEENYKKLANTRLPYQISFFDEDFGKVYKTDRQLGQLIKLLSILAVFIGCLGLYGLVVYTTAQRLKEIAIRKIIGAEVSQITFLLLRKFLLLALIGLVMATPIAYYLMDEWLQSFAYHITFGTSPFVKTALIMTFISLTTVGSQIWRAATSNPASVLRSE
jgi:putative ABC transport system permease protein